MTFQNHLLRSAVFAFFFLALTAAQLPASCMSYPVTLEDREANSAYIVLGRLVEKQAYWDAEHANIHTLNIIEVTAWLKGGNNQGASPRQIAVITYGGAIEDEAQIGHPALEIAPYNEYVFFLQDDEMVEDDKIMRSIRPNLLQAKPYAAHQGAITKQMGVFHDLMSEPDHTEASLLTRIQRLTGETPADPDGKLFIPRIGDTFPLGEFAAQQNAESMPITSFSPTTTNSGTIVAGDFITINGSGFGGTPGTVFYTNANDGGATFTSSGVASDNISWNDSQIQNKPAGDGGTGPINVNGAFTSATNLTINYAHIEINSSFASFGQTTRQRYLLVDKNGSGGYTFTYNTAFNANTAARDAYERALATWQCATFVNFVTDGSTSAIATAASDGVNIVTFDGTLPAGVLGRATSRFQASATGACNQFNTVWWTNEIDVQFANDPPAGCCSWNFGPSASGFLQFDFESVAVHELGHAHGLGHIISAGEVMHFALSNGLDVRSPSGNDVSGGNAKMGYSTLPLCFTPASVNGPMTLFGGGTCSLPVEWLHFSGVHAPNKGNVLSWSLASEHDNAGFEVQRSADGIQFESVGFVPSQGNSSKVVDYSYTDADVPAGATFHYRLEQRDLNGQSSRSEVVQIVSPAGSNLEVFPTVIADHIRVRGTTQQSSLLLRIFTAEGKVVVTREIASSSHTVDATVNFAQLPAGLYFYRIHDGNATHTGKLIATE